MKKVFIPLAAFALSSMLPALAGAAPQKAPQAVAKLAPTEGNTVQGNVTFKQEKKGVRIIASVSGLTAGMHGFHVHEKGDCSAPDGSSAGGHFNPDGHQHGKVDAAKHHAGDLPSLKADAKGNATLNTLVKGLMLTGDTGIVDRALIVHANPDDYTTQPTGNAGGRVACAVIMAK
ncbi:MAG: superoxide dismutase family protein [Azoarcus sp.]|jgi:Cu-Zn family superoxide dismutase|nr:superoxide dismutase family protein [Azoarcus sp.]